MQNAHRREKISPHPRAELPEQFAHTGVKDILSVCMRNCLYQKSEL